MSAAANALYTRPLSVAVALESATQGLDWIPRPLFTVSFVTARLSVLISCYNYLKVLEMESHYKESSARSIWSLVVDEERMRLVVDFLRLSSLLCMSFTFNALMH